MLLWDHDYKKLPQVFKKDHIELMLKAIDRSPKWNNSYGHFLRLRNKAILMLLYHSAARPREICKLKQEDLDKENGVIRISGANNKTKRDRVIPLPPKAVPYIREYFSQPTHYWRGSQYIFPSSENDFLSPERWKHIFREEILKPAGLWLPPEHPETGNKTPPRRSYTLRHTKLSEVMEKSKDLFLVANLAGHRKLESSKVYLHCSETYMDYMRAAL